jgi:aspartate ammonia-lyase
VPYIGYERAAALAKMALASGGTIRELAKTILPDADIDAILDAKVLAGMALKREL